MVYTELVLNTVDFPPNFKIYSPFLKFLIYIKVPLTAPS